MTFPLMPNMYILYVCKFKLEE